MRRNIIQTTIDSIFGINHNAIGVNGTTRRSVLLRSYQQSYAKASALALCKAKPAAAVCRWLERVVHVISHSHVMSPWTNPGALPHPVL